MKGFQRGCLDINAQEMARTIGKKIANSTVGKSTCQVSWEILGRMPEERRC
jgi:hypothetical protein